MWEWGGGTGGCQDEPEHLQNQSPEQLVDLLLGWKAQYAGEAMPACCWVCGERDVGLSRHIYMRR